MRRFAIMVAVMLFGLVLAATPAFAQASGAGVDDNDLAPGGGETVVAPRTVVRDVPAAGPEDVGPAAVAGQPEAQANVDTTAVLSSQLASTGFNVTVGMLLAAALVVAGGTLLFVGRRRVLSQTA